MFIFFNQLTLGNLEGLDWTTGPLQDGRRRRTLRLQQLRLRWQKPRCRWVGWVVSVGLVRWGRWLRAGWLGDGWLGGGFSQVAFFFFLKSRSMLGSSSKYRGDFVTFRWCGMIQWFVMSFWGEEMSWNSWGMIQILLYSRNHAWLLQELTF